VGEAKRVRALGQDTLRRCRRVIGPDRSTTLLTATALTLALTQLGEAEPARALGEDTLQRGRRTLGPDHLITRYMARVAVTDPPPLGDDAAEDDPSPPR
jgi:Tetratricopeptide repeat